MSYRPFRGNLLEVILGLESVPVVQGCATDGDPHKRSDHVHDGVRQFALQLGRSEAERNQLDRGVDEVTDEHSRCYDFRIGTLFLIEVPGATDAEEVAAITGAVDDQDHQVECLRWDGKLIRYEFSF